MNTKNVHSEYVVHEYTEKRTGGLLGRKMNLQNVYLVSFSKEVKFSSAFVCFVCLSVCLSVCLLAGLCKKKPGKIFTKFSREKDLILAVNWIIIC